MAAKNVVFFFCSRSMVANLTVMLHNGGFCNICTLKRCLLKTVDFKTNTPKNAHVPQLLYYKS
jgi:hypothetical protein